MPGGRNSASVHFGQEEAEPLRWDQLNAFPGRLRQIRHANKYGRGIYQPQTWKLGGLTPKTKSPVIHCKFPTSKWPKSDKALKDVVRVGRGKGFFDMPLQLLCQRHTWKAQSRKLLGH